MTTILLSYRVMGRRVSSISFPRFNWKMFYLLAALLSLCLLIFYVYSVNKITANILVVKNYNKQVEELSRENRMLQADLEQFSFWGKIMVGAKELSFEKTTNIKYLQMPSTDSSLARVEQIR